MGKKARGQISITAPLAVVGQDVRVLNYRMRPGQWEQGIVMATKYRPAYKCRRYDGSTFKVAEHWTYEVWIERPQVIDRYNRRRGGGYRIDVGDDAIEAL